MKKIMLFVLIMIMCLINGCGFITDRKNEEKPVLLWYLPGKSENDKWMVVNELNNRLKDKLDATVELHFIEASSYSETMDMMMATKKNFDLCFTSNWINEFEENVQKGGYIAIDNLLNEYAPELSKSIPEYIKNSAVIKGKMYAVPNMQVMYKQNSLVFLKELVDKYSFDTDSVKDIEDIEPFLKTIKENESDIYPYRLGYGVSMFTTEKYEQIEPFLGLCFEKNSDGSELSIFEETPEYRHGIKVLREWYQKGYIREDVNRIINDEAEVRAGKYAVWQMTNKPGAEAEYRTSTGRDVIIVPIEEPYLTSTAGRSTMTAISSTSKHPELAMQLLEIINNDKEIYNLICVGIQGVHYEMLEDNHIRIISDSGYTPNAAWKFGNQFHAYLMDTQADDQWKVTQQLNEQALRSPLIGISYDQGNIIKEIEQVDEVRKQYVSIENGSENPEQKYYEYIEALNAAGQQKIKEEISKQIKAWKTEK